MDRAEPSRPLETSLPPIVELRGIEKSFGRQQVLRGLDLKVPREKITFIIGRSGEGKSVTLKHIVGILMPDAGEVLIDGQSMRGAHLLQWKQVRRSVGILFQDGALFDGLSVGENVAFPLREFERLTARQLADRVDELLGLVGMPGTAARMPADLSIGEKKRVGLARALSLNPKLILYDEPTTSMDPLISELIDDLIVSMQTQISGLSSVVISHDMQSILRIAQHICMIHEGRIYFEGSADELRHSSDELLRQFVTGGLKGPLSKPIS
jgi:phospholipid/cholesterol/gamma-HCH transport system ATP-binding protein